MFSYFRGRRYGHRWARLEASVRRSGQLADTIFFFSYEQKYLILFFVSTVQFFFIFTARAVSCLSMGVEAPMKTIHIYFVVLLILHIISFNIWIQASGSSVNQTEKFSGIHYSFSFGYVTLVQKIKRKLYLKLNWNIFIV